MSIRARAFACVFGVLAGFGLPMATSPQLAAQEAQEPAQKPFFRDDLRSWARSLEAQIRREKPGISTGDAPSFLTEAKALIAEDPRNALDRALASVSGDPSNGEAWLLLAQSAMAIEPKDDGERYFQRDRALTAAYAAYERLEDKGLQSDALSVMADIFTQQENWRGAIAAYREALNLVPNPDRQATYNQLLDERGFRVTTYTVDADALVPRVCVEFSDPLKKDTDYTSFVVLSGGSGDTPVTAEGTKLCVDGLKHGTRYAMVIRQGLPSEYPDESLRKTLDYEFFVRDRAPSVQATGKTYVLPKNGQQGIPIVSVNTDKVSVDLYTIGDRSLVSAVQNEFLTSLGSYGIDQLKDSKGIKIWSGTLDVKRVQNENVTTAFPVLQAVQNLKPGVHVLVARPFVERAENTAEYADYYATQWFVVSDLGLTTVKANDGLYAMVRSVTDAMPSAGVEVKLVARNNDILGTATTDERGIAKFDPGLAKGEGALAPNLLVASTGSDYGFLDLQQSAFDFTDRGVAGRAAPTNMDAFLYTERGVYRSGETVNLTALLRDPLAQAATNAPLTLIVKRPDGVEYRRATVNDQGLGGRAFSFPLLSNAAPGSWSVEAFTDVKAGSIGSISFLVEDYVPERLEVKLAGQSPVVRLGEPVKVAVDARYLYGAPGADLKIGGDYAITPASDTGIAALQGYTVGLTNEPFENVFGQIESAPSTDAEGKGVIEVGLPDVSAPRPLLASINVSVSESGGRAVMRNVQLPIAPAGELIGVKQLEVAGQTAKFEIVVVSADGQRIAKPGLKWELTRIETTYQWYNRDGRWNYEDVRSERDAGQGTIDVTAETPAVLSVPVEDYAQYEIAISTEGDAPVETAFTFWNGWDGGGNMSAPDRLDLTLDAKAYASGSTMKVRLAPRFAGKATIAVAGDTFEPLMLVDVPEGGATFDVPVKAEWGAGAYLVAMAYRPIDIGNKRMPGRAIGLAWFDIDADKKKLALEIGSPATMRPRGDLSIPVKVAGLDPNEEAYVTVAAVDVGILNLTRYTLPDPSNHYFGQRQLSAEFRDLYGYLIDGMQGEAGAIRSGGDAAPANTGAIPPTQAPLARYSGVVKVGPDGMANVTFDVPAFNGTAKVMAIAWSKSRTGQAEKDVIIRDPVVATGTLPRFLAVGDQSRFNIAIDNVEGDSGSYTIDLDVAGPINVSADALRQTIQLDKGARTDLVVPVAAAGLGTAQFDLRITGPNVDLTQSYTLRVQPSIQSLVRRSVQTVPRNGGKVTVTGDLLAELLPGSGSIAVSVSPLAALDVPALLASLDRYPYGCSEQTVSRAMPLLYVNDIAEREGLASDGDAAGRINTAITTLLARQDSSGSFGLWSVGGNDLWLDAYVSDFLTRAREKGYEVPKLGFDMAMDRLRNQVANASDIQPETSAGLAYAMYVLARNGRPVMGDLRYVADSKLANVSTPLGRAQIAAALSMLGDRSRADNIFNSAIGELEAAKDNGRSRPDYGSRLRDGVAVLTLVAETKGAESDLQRIATLVDQTRGTYGYLSTQEQNWMVMAAQALSQKADQINLDVNGNPSKGAFYRIYREGAFEQGPVTITNNGSSDAKVILSVSGVPTTPEPAAEKGYKVERTLYTLDGKVADPKAIKQNERLVVVLKVTEQAANFARLLLVDPLPAGLEIDNPSLLDSNTVAALPWLTQDVSPSNAEYRDDRFVAAFDRDSSQAASFTVAYSVRAVSPGTYVHPGALVEDMYRPDLFGRSAFGSVVITAAK